MKKLINILLIVFFVCCCFASTSFSDYDPYYMRIYEVTLGAYDNCHTIYGTLTDYNDPNVVYNDTLKCNNDAQALTAIYDEAGLQDPNTNWYIEIEDNGGSGNDILMKMIHPDALE